MLLNRSPLAGEEGIKHGKGITRGRRKGKTRLQERKVGGGRVGRKYEGKEKEGKGNSRGR